MNIFQTAYKNPKIRLVFAICVCLWLAMVFQVVMSLAFSGDICITEAYAISDDIRIKDCTLESTACLKYDRQSFDMYGDSILREYIRELSGHDADVVRVDEPVPCYTTDLVTDDYRIHGTVSWSDNLNKAYLHCTVDVISNIGKAEDAYRCADKVLAAEDSITYVRVNSTVRGHMSENDCRDYTKMLFDRLDARPVSDGGADYYTQYGYSSGIPDNIQSGNGKVNVQVSYSYNENNNLTEISLGSPILNDNY